MRCAGGRRGKWLLGLLIVQSTSSFVLDRYRCDTSVMHPPSDTERRTLYARISSHTPAARFVRVFVLSGWELLARITPPPGRT
eukprot:351465-Chlamydomonas_euryale.AAC.10